jgi:hypothetical protein
MLSALSAEPERVSMKIIAFQVDSCSKCPVRFRGGHGEPDGCGHPMAMKDYEHAIKQDYRSNKHGGWEAFDVLPFPPWCPGKDVT